jgi:hypothetical protein
MVPCVWCCRGGRGRCRVQVKLFVYSKLAVVPRVKWLWPAPPMTKRQDECGAAHALLPSLHSTLQVLIPNIVHVSALSSQPCSVFRWYKSCLLLHSTLETSTSASAPSHTFSPLISVILHATQSSAQIYASRFYSFPLHIRGAAKEPVSATRCVRAHQDV